MATNDKKFFVRARLVPDAANAHNLGMQTALKQGFAHIESGRYEQAHAAAIDLIRADVHNPSPYLLLGRIALDHKNYQKADELYARARDLGRGKALFAASWAQYLVTVGRQNEAVESALEAAALPVEDAFTADTIGVVFSRTGFHDKAVPFFERAVARVSGNPSFHYNLGAARQFAGDFERAEAAYLAAIDLKPNFFRAWSSLVSLRKQSDQEARRGQLEALFAAHQHDADAALHYGHALAKIDEDMGRFESSFDWLVRAKQGKRASIDYSVEKDLALFGAAAQTVGPVARAAADAAPVFIVGLPRTGTTLVDRILSSHPDVVAAGELNTFADLIKKASDSSSNRVLDVQTLASVTDLAGIGADYLDRTCRLTRGAPRFTDKMPLNFFYAALIGRALPNARIVALRRAPMDSCLSNYRQLFSTGFSYYNYALDIADTADYYAAFDGLMAHWREHIPGQNFLEVHYEDIVHDQEAQTRRLLAFCGLSWNEACLRFHENEAPVSTASSVQVRQPLYSGSIDRWKRYGAKLDELRQRLGTLA